MKRTWLFQLAVSCLCLFVLPNIAKAQESLRVPRPAVDSDKASAEVGAPPGSNRNVLNGSVSKVSSSSPADSVAPMQQSSELSNQRGVLNPLQANATVDDMGASFRSTRAISDWQKRQSPQLQMQNEVGTMGSEHHGLKHHLASAFTIFGSAVGSAVVSVAVSQSSYARHAVNQMERNQPTIKVDAGHCPAMFDPAFQVPVRWWDILAQEQGSPTLGPQWKYWLSAVQNIFETRAHELHGTPGTAAIHVIVNPDGSMFDVSPYTGMERRNASAPPSQGTLLNLRQIIFEVGKFPHFLKVRKCDVTI